MVSPEMKEFADGVTFWRGRRTWPADFHNAQYEKWDRQNPNGDFSDAWWPGFLRTLRAWKATRPYGNAELTSRFTERATMLSDAWREACVPCLDDDISTVTWDDVKAFPDAAAQIKPTRQPSPVFTSKFCHFLLPRVFPVVDNEALGNGQQSYADYFKRVQDEWESTDTATRAELVRELTRLIESNGRRVYSTFPMINKIVELRLIGRHHPMPT